MGLADDIRAEVKSIFKSAWTERDGEVIPDTDDLKLSNDAVKLKGTVLYANRPLSELSGDRASYDPVPVL